MLWKHHWENVGRRSFKCPGWSSSSWCQLTAAGCRMQGWCRAGMIQGRTQGLSGRGLCIYQWAQGKQRQVFGWLTQRESLYSAAGTCRQHWHPQCSRPAGNTVLGCSGAEEQGCLEPPMVPIIPQAQLKGFWSGGS